MTTEEKPVKKSVYLINPICDSGHTNSYCALYVNAFLELDWSVVLLSPKNNHAKKPVNQDYIYIKAEPYSWIKKLRSFSNKNILTRKISSPISAFLKKINSYVSDWITHAENINFRERSFVHKTIFRSTKKTYRYFIKNPNFNQDKWLQIKKTRQMISNAITSTKVNPDLIFIMWLDPLYIPENDLQMQLYKRTPWAGIIFTPKFKPNIRPPETYCNSKHFRGCLMLISDYVDLYNSNFSQLSFYLAPDIADMKISSTKKNLAVLDKIQSFAKERKIILLIGSISSRKCLGEFIKASLLANRDKFCFVAAGRINLNSFSREDQVLISKSLSDTNSNILIHAEYISSEEEYNLILKNSDIIFSVYKNFQGSSNSLTKAAFFKKPILAADDTLIGETVIKENLGAVCNSSNIDEINTKLEILSNSKLSDFDFDLYQQKHSEDNLKSVLHNATQTWLQ